jgi:hypothetical protein
MGGFQIAKKQINSFIGLAAICRQSFFCFTQHRRTKKAIILIGTKKTVEFAVKNA